MASTGPAMPVPSTLPPSVEDPVGTLPGEPTPEDTVAPDTIAPDTIAPDTMPDPPEPPVDIDDEPAQFFEPSFIIGLDISSVPEQEDWGIWYSDRGVRKDFFDLARDRGVNYVRLRLFHDPSTPNGYQFEYDDKQKPYCNLEQTIQMAKRAKAVGMGVLLDLHYSDTWADPGDQQKPAAWVGLSFDQLVQAVGEYTEQVVRAMVDAKAIPEMVQVGNEITRGLLFPDGSTSDWNKTAALLQAGLQAVKKVDPRIQTVLHNELAGNAGAANAWVSSALDHGLQFDIVGLSTYTWYHGQPSAWRETFNSLAENHPELKFISPEYNEAYPEARLRINDIMSELPDGRGLGAFLWEPTQWYPWSDALFTASGQEWAANEEDWAMFEALAEAHGLN